MVQNVIVPMNTTAQRTAAAPRGVICHVGFWTSSSMIAGKTSWLARMLSPATGIDIGNQTVAHAATIRMVVSVCARTNGLRALLNSIGCGLSWHTVKAATESTEVDCESRHVDAVA